MRCYLIPNIALLLGVTSALDNGLAAQPPLGWRSWNCFQGNINDAVIRGQLDAMLIELGDDRTRLAAYPGDAEPGQHRPARRGS